MEIAVDKEKWEGEVPFFNPIQHQFYIPFIVSQSIKVNGIILIVHVIFANTIIQLLMNENDLHTYISENVIGFYETIDMDYREVLT